MVELGFEPRKGCCLSHHAIKPATELKGTFEVTGANRPEQVNGLFKVRKQGAVRPGQELRFPDSVLHSFNRLLSF